jgi:hypothetical protein
MGVMPGQAHAGEAPVHDPPTGQALPHVPQLSRSVFRLAQYAGFMDTAGHAEKGLAQLT